MIRDEVGFKPEFPLESFGDLEGDVRESGANPFIPAQGDTRLSVTT